MPSTDLPNQHAIAAAIDLPSRLKAFDADGSLTATARAAWDIIAPDVRAISEAYWTQWLRCFPDERVWAPQNTDHMITVGCTFLEDRFLHTGDRAWVDSIERSVAAAYEAGVSPLALLSMTSASDRAALDVLMRRLERTDARMPAMVDTLMRLSALESEITVAIYQRYREASLRVERDRLAAEFRTGIAAMVGGCDAGRPCAARADGAEFRVRARRAGQGKRSRRRRRAVRRGDARGSTDCGGADPRH